LLAFTDREAVEQNETAARGGLRILPGEGLSGSGIRIRPMGDVDLDRVRELRSVVRWAADPRAFDLLRGMREARWAVAEAPDGSLAGMVGAVPLGRIGVLCHLAVRDDHRNMGLGVRLSAWAVLYLRSRGAGMVRLYSTRRAEGLYRSLGFRPGAPRTVYRLDEATRGGGGEAADGHRVGTLSFGDLPELYGLDRWSYGADRSALIFATLRLHPGGGLIARDASGSLKGYLVRSSSGRVNRIGPFVTRPRMWPGSSWPVLCARAAAHPWRSPCPASRRARRTSCSASSASRDAGIACRWSSVRRTAFFKVAWNITARRRIWLLSWSASQHVARLRQAARQHFSFLPLGSYPAIALRGGFRAEALSSAAEQRTALPC
jgi:ribosomal protein S18 acetylase RimI-like enzyme